MTIRGRSESIARREVPVAAGVKPVYCRRNAVVPGSTRVSITLRASCVAVEAVPIAQVSRAVVCLRQLVAAGRQLVVLVGQGTLFGRRELRIAGHSLALSEVALRGRQVRFPGLEFRD
ncbi:MAG TPA: hypothetical protein VHB69_15365 [Mycobacteriales bacterium]|nr:hypothetical protein [Mycobacteriales bacterium]